MKKTEGEIDREIERQRDRERDGEDKERESLTKIAKLMGVGNGGGCPVETESFLTLSLYFSLTLFFSVTFFQVHIPRQLIYSQ